MGWTGQALSPVDRLEAMAERMSERAAAMKQVADAAKPLYASLDDTQKRLFGMLGGHMLMGHSHRDMGMMGGMGMGMMGGGQQGGMGMTGDRGMGMMGRGRQGMGMMGNELNDADGSDEE